MSAHTLPNATMFNHRGLRNTNPERVDIVTLRDPFAEKSGTTPSGIYLRESLVTQANDVAEVTSLPTPKRKGSMNVAYEESTILDLGGETAGFGGHLTWHVQDISEAQAGTFTLKGGGGGRQPIDLSAGSCFDWPTSRIAWTLPGTNGVPPQKEWAASRAKLPPKPGDDWKLLFWVQLGVLIDGEPVRVIWEQAQDKAWRAFKELMLALAKAGPDHLPKLPLIVHTGHSPIMVPTFEVQRFVDRPLCLPKDQKDDSRAHSGNGTSRSLSPHGDQAPPAGRWAAPPSSLDDLDDEIPF